MGNSEMSEREKKVFQTGLFDDLTVQDAFTIIALCAAQEKKRIWTKVWLIPTCTSPIARRNSVCPGET